MRSLRLCLFTVLLCYLYSALAEEPLRRFTTDFDFNNLNCFYDGIVFNEKGVSLMRCVALCAVKKGCIGVFYKSTERNCTACTTINRFYTVTDMGTIYYHVNWLPYKGSIYLLGTDALSYRGAEAYCRQKSAHLVQIENEKEDIFIKDFLNNVNPSTCWIGLKNDHGQWQWTTSNENATYTNWASGAGMMGQESSMSEIERSEFCVTMRYLENLQWRDYECNGLHGGRPLCEKEINASNKN